MLRRAWDDLQLMRSEGVPEHVVAKMGRMVATTAYLAESFDEVCHERDVAIEAVAEASDYISRLEAEVGVNRDSRPAGA